MNTLQRVMTAFAHSQPDRVPVYTHIDNVDVIEKVTGAKIETDPLRVTADAIQILGIDITSGLSFPRWGSAKIPYLPDEDNPEKQFTYRYDAYLYWMERRPFSSIDEAYAWAIKNWKVQPRSFLREQARKRIEQRLFHQKYLGEHCLLMHQVEYVSLEQIFDMIDFEAFCYMLYDKPDYMKQILDSMTENALIFNEVLLEEDPVPVVRFGDDLAFKTGPIISNAWLEKEYFPRQKQLANQIKAKNIKILFHSCGNITSLVDNLIELGIDALQPLEITAGVDIARLKEKYGKKLVLMGNVDTNILKYGTDADVRRDVRRCFDAAAANGGYFMEASGGFAGAPAENVISFFDEAHKYGIYNTSRI